MSIRIERITSKAALTAVGQFRYRIYVEEMGRPQKYADHGRREVIEPLDEGAAIFAAYDRGGQVVGTVRQNLAAESPLGDYVDFYRLEEFGQHFPNFVSITTKLMVADRYKRSTLGARMGQEAYRYGLRRGQLIDVIDCNSHLEPFFTKLGYRPYCGRRQHEEYGDVLPMVLYGRDWLHLSLVDSPLLKIARQEIGEEVKRSGFRSVRQAPAA